MSASAVSTLRTLDDVIAIAKSNATIVPVRMGESRSQGRVCKTDGQLLASMRWAAEQGGAVAMQTQDGKLHELSPEAFDSLDGLVPTNTSAQPLVAFVGKSPSSTDAARGIPLAGMDGDCFRRDYLEPLGLSLDEVMVTHLAPVADGLSPEVAKRFVGFAKAELDAWQPKLVVALGKEAREELGPLAQFNLPHPAVVRRHGGGSESPELKRKLKRLRFAVDKVRKGETRNIHIAKLEETGVDVLPEMRVVYGVALDPYQFDSQDDWVSPLCVRDTAWGWMANSRVIGFMHEQAAAATPVESWLWPYPSDADYQAAMQNLPHKAFASSFGTDTVHSGAWVVATRIDDPALWQAICSGDIGAYSIGGFGTRTPVDGSSALPQVTFISQ